MSTTPNFLQDLIDSEQPEQSIAIQERSIVELRPQSLQDAIDAVLTNRCQALATADNLDRLETATKLTLERGIQDDNQVRQANDLLGLVKAGAGNLGDTTKPFIGYFHGLHKRALAAVAPFTSRWSAMEDTLKVLILRYDHEQERLRRKAQEEADRIAEQERRRLAEESQRALRAGNIVAARELVQEAESVVTPMVPSISPVLPGASKRESWEVEIVDPIALLAGVVEGKVPLSIIKEWNRGLMNTEATSMGGKLSWPGIKTKPKTVLARRR